MGERERTPLEGMRGEGLSQSRERGQAGLQSSAGGMVSWREDNQQQEDPGYAAVDAWLRDIGLVSAASYDLVGNWLRDNLYHLDFPTAL